MKDPLKDFLKDALNQLKNALKRFFLKFLAPVLVLMLVLEALRSVMEQGNSGATGLLMFAVLVVGFAVFKIMKRNLLG